jgi:hypothetical protein
MLAEREEGEVQRHDGHELVQCLLVHLVTHPVIEAFLEFFGFVLLSGDVLWLIAKRTLLLFVAEEAGLLVEIVVKDDRFISIEAISNVPDDGRCLRSEQSCKGSEDLPEVFGARILEVIRENDF